MSKTKILVVDDHPLLREGVIARISRQPDLEVAGEASDERAALTLLDSLRPELMIVDIALRDTSGLALIKKIAQRDQPPKILVLSAHDEGLFAERALRAGAQGYLNKQEAQTELLDAIRSVLRGERYLSPAVTQRIVGRAVGDRRSNTGVESLSDRELEIFELIGRGNGTRAIAEQLNLSIHTIETHRENIRVKLDLRTGMELVRHAVQWVIEAG